MAWFSPLKGAYPGLVQIDKTLAVGSRETGIVRGSLVYVDGSGETPVFRLAGDTQATDPTAYLYFTLVGQEDFQAGMAGTIGQGPAGGVARITALAVGMPMEFQSDQYDHEGDFDVGTLLTVGAGVNGDGDTVDGLLCVHATGENVVAQVTAVPAERWVNDAVRVPGRATGALLEVIAARTLWVPTLTVS
jgi:hypothetical protein